MSRISPAAILERVSGFKGRGDQSGFWWHQAWPLAASISDAFAVGLISSRRDGGGGRSAVSGTAIQGS